MSDAGDRKSYEYGERRIEPMPERELRFGEGRIAGGISMALGVMSFFGALCFRFPELLTTRELRDIYDVDLLRTILRAAMWIALGLGLFAFVRTKGRRYAGAIGVVATILAYFAGGQLEERAVTDIGPGIAVDWMVLDLLKSTVIFIFLEKLLPKYPDQPILRPEWQLDLGYFAVNHLLLGVL